MNIIMSNNNSYYNEDNNSQNNSHSNNSGVNQKMKAKKKIIIKKKDKHNKQKPIKKKKENAKLDVKNKQETRHTHLKPKDKLKIVNDFKNNYTELYDKHLKSKIENSLKEYKSMKEEDKVLIRKKIKNVKNIHQKVIQSVNILDMTLKNKKMISSSKNKKKFNNFIFKNIIGTDIKLKFENPGILFFKSGNLKLDYLNAFDIAKNIVHKIISDSNISSNNNNSNNNNNNNNDENSNAINNKLLNNSSISTSISKNSVSNNNTSNNDHLDYFDSFVINKTVGKNKETLWIFIIVIVSSLLSNITNLEMFKNKSELDRLYSIPCLNNCLIFGENNQSKGGNKKGKKDEKDKKKRKKKRIKRR